MGKVAERPGNRLLGHHFAKLAHDHKGDKTTQGIAQQNSRSSHLDGARRAEEKPRTNGPTQGNELYMPVFQGSF